MEEYRDLRHSVPGWWLVITTALMLHLYGKLPDSLDNQEIIFGVLGFLIAGPALSFFINSFSYIILSPWFWSFGLYKDKNVFCRIIVYLFLSPWRCVETEYKKQIGEWTKQRFEANYGGYTDQFHSALGRRWSYVLTSFNSFLGIVTGLILGAALSKSMMGTLPEFSYKTILVVSVVFISVIFFFNSLKVRRETLEMEGAFRTRNPHFSESNQ